MSATDPTRTSVLRRRYAQKLRGQFSDINTEIRDGVRDRDVFRLEAEALADPVPRFEFETDDRKVEAFGSWLRRQQRRGVLETISRNENTYVRSGYDRGYDRAATELRKQGIDVTERDLEATFNRGVRRDSLQLLYTRNYEALRGITDAVATQVSREVSQGLAEGVNPRVMARRLTDRVDTIGKVRATTLARTETINSFSEGSLDNYERLGITEVSGRAEAVSFTTAGDRRVCPQCEALEGTTYTINEARGVIPQHPNCRCAWRPITN